MDDMGVVASVLSQSMEAAFFKVSSSRVLNLVPCQKRNTMRIARMRTASCGYVSLRQSCRVHCSCSDKDWHSAWTCREDQLALASSASFPHLLLKLAFCLFHVGDLCIPTCRAQLQSEFPWRFFAGTSAKARVCELVAQIRDL